jgi:hypothetical protein
MIVPENMVEKRVNTAHNPRDVESYYHRGEMFLRRGAPQGWSFTVYFGFY